MLRHFSYMTSCSTNELWIQQPCLCVKHWVTHCQHTPPLPPTPHHHGSASGVSLPTRAVTELTCRTWGGGDHAHRLHPRPCPPPQWWQVRSHRKTAGEAGAGHQTTLQSRGLADVERLFNAPTHACSQSQLLSRPEATQKPVGLLSARPTLWACNFMDHERAPPSRRRNSCVTIISRHIATPSNCPKTK